MWLGFCLLLCLGLVGLRADARAVAFMAYVTFLSTFYVFMTPWPVAVFGSRLKACSPSYLAFGRCVFDG
jgi:hypothetical protein